MKKLVILDYSTCTVHIHNLERKDPITDEYISALGYHANDCYWMTGNVEVRQHKGILK